MNVALKWGVVVAMAAVLWGCRTPLPDPDGNPLEGEDLKINQYVYSLMCEWYLWNDEVKAITPDYTLEYGQFFLSLLSSKDGRQGFGPFSHIEREPATSKAGTTISLGFEFTIPVTIKNFGMLARVLYVYPGSPADGKLKRGDWIGKINGEPIDYANYYDFYSSGTVTLTPVEVSLVSENTVDIVSKEPITLSAGLTDTNPILVSKTIQTTAGPVGYLLYNAFETGPGGFTDKTYDNQLKSVFSKFKADGVRDLVLDLRYNGGGYVASSQLLASLIVSSDQLGTGVFARQVYNRDKNRTDVLHFLSAQAIGDANIDMQRLFVLTGYRTASASELIINSMRGVDVDIIQIGDRTVGKNVGSEEFTAAFDGYNYSIFPIMFSSYNAKNEGDYTDGFAPDYLIDEEDGFPVWHELGDPAEAMLAKALAVIEGTQTTDAAPRKRNVSGVERTGLSIPIRYSIQGMIGGNTAN